MAISGRGLFYMPSPPPQAGGEYALRNWCEREFSRIAEAIREGQQQGLRLDVIAQLPERPFEGMVMYFAADAVGPGSSEGLHEYRSSAWQKL